MDEMNRNPNNWKWGIFYFDPNDKRLFVPKRIPVFGFTLNFANPWSAVIIAGLIISIVFAFKAASSHG